MLLCVTPQHLTRGYKQSGGETQPPPSHPCSVRRWSPSQPASLLGAPDERAAVLLLIPHTSTYSEISNLLLTAPLRSCPTTLKHPVPRAQVCSCNRPSCGVRGARLPPATGDPCGSHSTAPVPPQPNTCPKGLPDRGPKQHPGAFRVAPRTPALISPIEPVLLTLCPQLQQFYPRQSQGYRVPGKQEAFPSPIMCSKVLDIRRTVSLSLHSN